jgi:hypothetical protein
MRFFLRFDVSLYMIGAGDGTEKDDARSAVTSPGTGDVPICAEEADESCASMGDESCGCGGQHASQSDAHRNRVSIHLTEGALQRRTPGPVIELDIGVPSLPTKAPQSAR